MANTKENTEVKLSRKQIRDAAKKKSRTKKTIIKAVVISAVAIVLAAAIGLGMFFASYDPVRDNLRTGINSLLTMPYSEPGHESITEGSKIFPLYQSAYFYFYNNHGDILSEDCCMEIKDYVEYWNDWNRQTEYTVVPSEFNCMKTSDNFGHFAVLIDIKDKDQVIKDTMTMSGTFSYDASTNMITMINMNMENMIELSDAFGEIVLGIAPEEETEE